MKGSALAVCAMLTTSVGLVGRAAAAAESGSRATATSETVDPSSEAREAAPSSSFVQLGPRGIPALEVAAIVGGGTRGNLSGGELSPFGFGVGGQVGVTYYGGYTGLRVVRYVGQSSGIVGTDSIAYAWDVGFGVELFRHITVRPFAGLGVLHVSGGNGRDYFFPEEGIALAVYLPPVFLVGVDAALMQVANFNDPESPSCLGGEVSCYTLVEGNLHATLGARF